MMIGFNILTSEVWGINVILGGFALFLLGITYLGDGLKEIAGPKIRIYIEKYTNNIFKAILVGTAITAIMNSSTAATVISISLVRAGLMKLDQAIGISIGANLGTTVTSLIIGLDIEAYGYYFVFFGALIIAFASRKKVVEWGRILFGFGAIFVGLQLMGDQLIKLQDLAFFEQFMETMSRNPWLALIGGTIATAIINSSTAVIGIVQKIYGNGGMDMIAASAFVFGSNIGTTLTAILASLGGSYSTKRAGWFHAIYNIIGALLAMLIIIPYSNFIVWLNGVLQTSDVFAIGLNHFIFNMASTLLVIPFVPAFIKLLEIIIPGEDKIKQREKIEPLDESLIYNYPDGAFQLAQQTTIKMADLVIESIETTEHYLHSGDKEDYDVIMQLEELVDNLDTDLTTYLLKIATHASDTGVIAETYTKHLQIIKNFERMSDLCVNIAEFYYLMFDAKETFSKPAMEDITQLYQMVYDLLHRSVDIYITEDSSSYEILQQNEKDVNETEIAMRERHFQRMAEGHGGTKVANSIYVDVLGMLERIADRGVSTGRYTFSVIKEHEPDIQAQN